MQTIYSVRFTHNGIKENKHFDKRSEATSFAKKISKMGTSTVIVWKLNGHNDGSSFVEYTSSLVARFADGLKY